MTPSLCRLRHVVVSTLIACGSGAQFALAQEPQRSPSDQSDLATFQARVPIGDVVYVTDATGLSLKGKLAAASGEALLVRVAAETRRIPVRDIRRIQWQQRDSLLNGILIGAAVGAAPGVYWLVADPNECRGMCPEEYAFIAIGAIVGGLIDRAVTDRLTVYSTQSSSRWSHITVGAIVTRTRQEIHATVAFK